MPQTLDAGTGADGSAVVSVTTNLNTTSLIGRPYGDMVSYPCTAVSSQGCTVNATPNGIDVGDEVLLMNIRGNGITGNGDVANEGNYETFVVDEVNGNDITFDSAKTKFYGDDGDDTNIGTDPTHDQQVILMRIPNYESLTIDNGANLYGDNFNNYYVVWRYGTNIAYSPVGGIVFIRVSGTLTLTGSINMQGKGPRGGNTDSGGGYGAWANANGGIGHPAALYNADPGRGGSHATAGPAGSQAAAPTYGDSTALVDKMHLGSGGAGGRSGADTGSTAGGGIVALFAGTLDMYGSISAAGQDNGVSGDWTGGSGSGGSILLQAGILKTNSSSLAAAGGTSSAAYGSSPGGEGRIAIYYNTINGSTSGLADITPYVEDDLQLPYFISGTVSADCEIRVYDTNWAFVRAESVSTGPYSILNLPSAGPFNVIADPVSESQNIIAYKDVSGVQ